jgi:transglutaminase-like putative cysteine protease
VEKVQNSILQLGWPDYALTGIASGLAVYCAGYSLGAPDVAYLMVGLVLLGTVVAAILQAFLPKKLARADGVFYLALALVAMFYEGGLNDLLPSEGFPEQLRVAGWLCWMLGFCSFVAWRDSTLLFQAVPGIALFGFIGAWDTFRASPFLFFGFLLCYATLFARSHSRSMMLRAVDSGYVSTSLDAKDQSNYSRALRRGPWRWMAGPEWALVTALVVVLISLIGAPFLRFSLQGVSGFVKISIPNSPSMRRALNANTPAVSSINFTNTDVEGVGTGPHAPLIGRPIFSLTVYGGPQLPTRYLRYHTYLGASARGWDELTDLANDTDEHRAEFAANTYAGKSAASAEFTIHYSAGSYDAIPIPGDIKQGSFPTSDYRLDGTIINSTFAFAPGQNASGSAAYATAQPVTAPAAVGGVTSYSDDGNTRTTQRVRRFAEETVAGSKNGYEKAVRLRDAIAKQCTYDLNAPAVPEGKDPVDYFLFESKRGYCDLFASAMTVCARAAHLPARFVIGYANFTNPGQDSNGNYQYSDTDFHAWSEIYFNESGWTIFDATDGAAEAPGAGRGSKQDSGPWYETPTVIYATAAILLFGLITLGLRLAKRFNFTLVKKKGKLAEVEKQYVNLIRMLETRTGKPRRPSQTPFEYLESVKPYLDGSFDSVSLATGAFVQTFYGSKEPSDEQISDFTKLVNAARAKLKNIKRSKEDLA